MLSASGFKEPAAKKTAAFKTRFNRKHFVKIKKFIDADLAARLKKQLDAAQFYERKDSDIARESSMKQNGAFDQLFFLAHDPKLFEFVRALTGCSPIGGFDGRIYRFLPDSKHYDSWHSDLGRRRRDRLVALSINFSPRKFEGGALSIRNARSKRVLSRVRNTGLGDAVFFRISPALEHRVEALKGEVERRVFVGWFVRGKAKGESGLKKLMRKKRK